MGDNTSDEDFGDDWNPYSQRAEWKDVTPLEQDDGPNPVVAIAYSTIFKDVYGYFRAILSSGEKSSRALELTQDALRLNAANYTVWQYRRDILRHLGLDLHGELSYTEQIMIDNPKNYQVWHHRRVIVEWMNDASEELHLTEEILRMDAKNYHAWQHRQWAIKTFHLHDQEIAYVDKLLASDVRNNSAWNQRFFILSLIGIQGDTLRSERLYTMNRIQIVKDNESSWNYLRGILKLKGGTLAEHPEVLEFCEDLYSAGCRSPHLLSFMIDTYEEICLKHIEDYDVQQIAAKISVICEGLATEHDIIRCKYWKYVENRFKIRFERSELLRDKCRSGGGGTSGDAHDNSVPI